MTSSRQHLLPTAFLAELESALADAPFFGATVGGMLNDVAIIDLINGRGEWGMARWFRLSLGRWWLCRRGAIRPAAPPAANERLLITWRSSSPRIDELLIPIIKAIGPNRSIVLYEKDNVAACVPQGCEHLRLFDVLPHEPGDWRPEFRRCWPAWQAALQSVCRRYGLSAAIYQRLAIELTHGSQIFVGCRQFLQASRPAAVVTEYDRGSRWSCLVLAARSLGIPSFTLQHGVIDEQATGYAPVLADKMFCWGETAVTTMVRQGVPRERLVVGGCPRLERRLTALPSEGRAKLGLDGSKPIAMLATAPYTATVQRQLVDLFVGCMRRLPGAVGVVRLHPSEKLEAYREVAQANPSIHFFGNAEATLDESLAAAELVVVHNSGIGSDALVKGRSAIVVDIPPSPLGHGRELVEQAGCRLVKTEEELTQAVAALLFDGEQRQRQTAAAEAYVGRFCAYFGQESARRIAEVVNETAVAKRGGSARECLPPQRAESVGR